MKKENLSLTKKSRWEIIVSSKLREKDYSEKQINIALAGIEIFAPLLVLLVAGILFAPRK